MVIQNKCAFECSHLIKTIDVDIFTGLCHNLYKYPLKPDGNGQIDFPKELQLAAREWLRKATGDPGSMNDKINGEEERPGTDIAGRVYSAQCKFNGAGTKSTDISTFVGFQKSNYIPIFFAHSYSGQKKNYGQPTVLHLRAFYDSSGGVFGIRFVPHFF